MTLPLRILLVDDDDRYAEMIEVALESDDERRRTELRRLSDGDLAVSYLLGQGEYEDRAAHPLPDLVLLDQHMPRMDGTAVLARLAESTGPLPAICLMSSTEARELARMRAPGAMFCIGKPDSFLVLEKKLGLMVDFFRQVLDLPQRPR